MKRAALVALLSCISCSATGVIDIARIPPDDVALVERVVDGDTIIVRMSGARVRVRLIGIDTPEVVKPGTPVRCFGRRASEEARRLLDGERVRLEYDVEDVDRFHRRLAYVVRARDGLFVNEWLVSNGFARAMVVAPNVSHSAAFARAERNARAARLGLWGACADAAGRER